METPSPTSPASPYSPPPPEAPPTRVVVVGVDLNVGQLTSLLSRLLLAQVILALFAASALGMLYVLKEMFTV